MRRFPSSVLFIISALLPAPNFVCAQQPPVDSPSIILRVQLDADAKVKLGAPVSAHSVDPLYSGNHLVLPAGSAVTGRVSAVQSVSRDKRLDAISHGDFTPLHEAKIEFSGVRLSDGVSLPISALPASQSGDVLRFQTSSAKRQSLFHQAWADLTNRKTQAVDMVKAPGKVARLKKILYSQLPWHPQAIESGTQYDITLLQPIAVPTITSAPARTPPAQAGESKAPPIKDSSVLHARLQGDLSSKTAKRDDPVAAVVTEPVIDAQGKIEIPQGAVLHGRVLQTREAKKWGKNGALRFTFNRVDFAQGEPEQVAGVPTAVDGSKNGSLKLDAEGGVQPDTNKGIMLPLVMGWLAASSIFDEDAGAAKIGVTSNGFGLITRIIAMSTGSRYVGAAIGSIATARTVYSRFLAHGRDVTFARNSQIEVELGPVHSLAHAH
jgi:hypothetical protein